MENKLTGEYRLGLKFHGQWPVRKYGTIWRVDGDGLEIPYTIQWPPCHIPT